MQPAMERRRAATQATMDRFKGKQFKPGRCDCAQMVKSHLRAMGRPVKSFAGHGPYHSIPGGVKQLKKLGHDSLLDAMDAYFERIAPASAWLGDVVSIPSEEGPGGLCIMLQNGRIFGYHQDAVGAEVLQPAAITVAWRVA